MSVKVSLEDSRFGVTTAVPGWGVKSQATIEAERMRLTQEKKDSRLKLDQIDETSTNYDPTASPSRLPSASTRPRAPLI